MRGVAWAFLIVSAASAFTACSLGALDGFSGGEQNDGGPDATIDGTSSDAPSALDGNVDPDAGPDANRIPCTRHDAGAKMIHVGDFCIDETEVTQKDYAVFLAAKMSQPGTQPAECAWNMEITPLPGCGFDPQSTKPVVGVDFCDARLYCEWAGKHICGARKGATLTASDSDTENAQKDEWYAACSNNGDGLHQYPYGNTYDASACAGDDPDASVSPVGSHPGCVGGVPGVFDMSGNAWEWDNVCTPTTGGPQNDKCLLRGGGAGSSPAQLRCLGRNAAPYSRDTSFCTVGFRCCSDE